MKSKLSQLSKCALSGLLSATIFTSCASFSSVGLSPTEEAMLSTYPLYSKKIVGTCFFVAMKDRRSSNHYFPVVVTSTHIIKAAGKDPLFIPLRMIGSDGKLSFALVKLGVGKIPPFYVSHPTLDIAAFPLLLPDSLEPQFALRLLQNKNLLKGGFRAGENVSFLGFPEGLPGTPDLFPVLRAARVASYDPSLFSAQMFLLNGDVYPGDSGSPIIMASEKGSPKVGGMVIERIEMYKGERSPIALAVDATAIRETLDLLAKRMGL